MRLKWVLRPNYTTLSFIEELDAVNWQSVLCFSNNQKRLYMIASYMTHFICCLPVLFKHLICNLLADITRELYMKQSSFLIGWKKITLTAVHSSKNLHLSLGFQNYIFHHFSIIYLVISCNNNLTYKGAVRGGIWGDPSSASRDLLKKLSFVLLGLSYKLYYILSICDFIMLFYVAICVILAMFKINVRCYARQCYTIYL